MKDHILVTGGAGFIGSHLVDRILAQGNKVIVLDNLFTGTLNNLQNHTKNENFIFVKGDICDPLEDLFSKFKIGMVFHLAAMGRVRNSFHYPLLTHKTNVTGTLNLLEVSRKYMVRKFIFASSSSVYGDQDQLPLVETFNPRPVSPYALQKWQSEQYVNYYSEFLQMDTTSLRFFNVYGPRQRGDLDHSPLIPGTCYFIGKATPPVIYGNGNHSRDFTYVEDILDGLIRAAFSSPKATNGRTINIGRGKNYTVEKIVQRTISAYGQKISPIYLPSQQEPKDTLADLELAKELLGFCPKTSLSEGLSKTISWYQNQH